MDLIDLLGGRNVEAEEKAPVELMSQVLTLFIDKKSIRYY
jgi:hypothetical protein